MATTLTSAKDRGGQHGRPGEPGGNGDGRRRYSSGVQNNRLGIAFALAGIGMLFTALTSSYVVRQGLGLDWRQIPMPRILLVNTAILVAGSVTIELARLTFIRGSRQKSNIWVVVTLVLGLAFLSGQALAWRSLSLGGFYLATNPHSSFFYVLTGLHGIHLAGGITVLAYLSAGALHELVAPPMAEASGWSVHLLPDRRSRWLEGTAIYWHFMDVLWIYLLVLLFVWS